MGARRFGDGQPFRNLGGKVILEGKERNRRLLHDGPALRSRSRVRVLNIGMATHRKIGTTTKSFAEAVIRGIRE